MFFVNRLCCGKLIKFVKFLLVSSIIELKNMGEVKDAEIILSTNECTELKKNIANLKEQMDDFKNSFPPVANDNDANSSLFIDAESKLFDVAENKNIKKRDVEITLIEHQIDNCNATRAWGYQLPRINENEDNANEDDDGFDLVESDPMIPKNGTKLSTKRNIDRSYLDEKKTTCCCTGCNIL